MTTVRARTSSSANSKDGRNLKKVLDVPTQDMRDSLLHLIFYQGDTEFGSSEQQRKLIDTAPTDYDRQCCCASCARSNGMAGKCATC